MRYRHDYSMAIREAQKRDSFIRHRQAHPMYSIQLDYLEDDTFYVLYDVDNKNIPKFEPITVKHKKNELATFRSMDTYPFNRSDHFGSRYAINLPKILLQAKQNTSYYRSESFEFEIHLNLISHINSAENEIMKNTASLLKGMEIVYMDYYDTDILDSINLGGTKQEINAIKEVSIIAYKKKEIMRYEDPYFNW